MILLACRQLTRALRGSPSAAGAAARCGSGGNIVGGGVAPPVLQLQQWRGIRVKVFDGNLDRALIFMKRQMVSSGVERLIRAKQRHHLKNSEKRVLAGKRLQRKIRSQDFAKNLREILTKKVRDESRSR